MRKLNIQEIEYVNGGTALTFVRDALVGGVIYEVASSAASEASEAASTVADSAIAAINEVAYRVNNGAYAYSGPR